MPSNQDDPGNGSRSFFRVKASLPLRVSRVSDDDYREVANEILTRIDPALPDVDPALIGWLDRIERKLDRLLDHQGLTSLHRIDDRERLRIEMSGSGLSFPSGESFDVGSALLLEFELPETPIRLVRCLGRVVEEAAGGESDRVAVAFETIRQVDRDALVRCTLAIQRQEILAGEQVR